MPGLAPLPIDDFLPQIADTVRIARAAVIVAAPGAGKTTRVPPALALAADRVRLRGGIIVLQPRRVAARAIAQRIAEERGWTLGEDVGWHVRFERRFSPRTRVLIATEGILTARLLADPLLSDFHTIILDEFHERSMHADLGIALAKQAWLARDDLRIVVMSATMDAAPVAAYLQGCPIVEVPGRSHAVEISYAPQQPLHEAVRDALMLTRGNVLAFLPGAPEIRRAMDPVAAAVSGLASGGVEVLALHGSLDAAEQDRIVRPASARRVILATNIAETSLTVPGVHAVIDSGLHKVARYDPSRGIDSLDLERISADSADQRAGRAGRLGPGIARRLWDSRDRLRPHREPDIARIDLAAPLLDLLAWGGDPASFEWFESPPAEAIDAAWTLLERLGAIATGTAPRTLTPLGHALQRLPLHPRLGRILLAADGARDAARACALLAERHFLAPRREATTCDLLAAIDAWPTVPAHVQRVARELEQIAPASGSTLSSRALSESQLRRAIFDGYADRVARRRAPGSARVLLASGHGAAIAPESGVRDGEFLVALDVQAQTQRHGYAQTAASEASIRMASVVDRDWLQPTHVAITHEFDREAGRVRAYRREHYGALILSERQIDPDPEVAARTLAEAYLARPLDDEAHQVLRRLAFAGHQMDAATLVERAARNVVGTWTLAAIDLAAALLPAERRDLDRLAPERLPVPSGRSAPLTYHEDGTVSAAVKLQELFGLGDTPRLGREAQPVLLHLLAPNGRPVQMTRDLRSFWSRTYPDVRKELRGRYPRHPWPEDPWTAEPTARTTRRKPG